MSLLTPTKIGVKSGVTGTSSIGLRVSSREVDKGLRAAGEGEGEGEGTERSERSLDVES